MATNDGVFQREASTIVSWHTVGNAFGVCMGGRVGDVFDTRQTSKSFLLAANSITGPVHDERRPS